MNRDRLYPLAVFVSLFALAGALITLGNLDRYRELAPDPLENAETRRIERLYKGVTGKDLGASAARVLLQNATTSPVASKWPLRILLDHDGPSVQAAILLHSGSFDRGSKKITGWNETADVIFGRTPETLSDAELALYLCWIDSGQSNWAPAHILQRRQQVLSRLKRVGSISSSNYERLSAAPLVLRPNPTPID